MEALIKAEQLEVGDIVRFPNGNQRLYVDDARDGHLGFTPYTKKGFRDRRCMGWNGYYGGDQFVVEMRGMPRPE